MGKEPIVVYVVPEASAKGGMTSIVLMFTQYGVFNGTTKIHFNTSFSHTNKVSRFIQSFSKRFHFMMVLLRSKADVVYIMTSSNWGFYDKILYAIIARTLGVKVVLNPVGGYFKDFYLSGINKWLVKISMTFANCIVVSGGAWYKFFKEEFTKNSIIQIPNPVNANHFQQATPGKREKLQVVFVSRLVRDKGVDELLQIIKLVFERSDRFIFRIIGDGDMRAELQNQLAEEIKFSKVEMLGFVDEALKVRTLAESDIFLFTSHFEVLPISILEAMASGLPIVSTNVGSIPEAIVDSENGYLFLPHDAAPMAACLVALEKNRSELERLGLMGLERCRKNFDLKAVLQKQTEVFRYVTKKMS